DGALTAVAKAAFASAGSTNDATIIEIKFALNNPATTRVSFDLLFGSDEYPEFKNSSYVDIGAVFVDGVNYALFNGNASQPLSVIQANFTAGNFVDNTTGFLPIEYDGISTPLRIIAPLGAGVGGVHTIRIGVADTGDGAWDSALYASNLRAAGSGTDGSIGVISNDDILDAGVGNDTLNGGAGADRMIGGQGADTYYVDNAGDQVVETDNVPAGGSGLKLDVEFGSAIDTVISSISFALENLTYVENLTLALGSAAVTGSGNALENVIVGNERDNTLAGNAGNDKLDGGAGADTMQGGANDDLYTVNAAGDIVSELPGEGTDRVQASITYTLPAEVENLTLIESASINGVGNAAANSLSGNSGNNVLTGGAGNDTLDGGAGKDTAAFALTFAEANVNVVGGVGTVVSTEGTDQLNDIEFLQFTDQRIFVGINAAPTGVVTIAGTATQGQTLTASNTLADVDGIGANAIGYQWKAAGVAIAGANGATFTTTQAQVGKAITVTASYADDNGTLEAVTSTATSPVVNVKDAPVVTVFGNRSAPRNQPISLNLGALFSDLDGDVLSFSASGLPLGLSINATSGFISGVTPSTTGLHPITVTGSDSSNASASVNFDLSVVTGNTFTASVVTRSGNALPGVTAYELISNTPSGSLYAFKNISIDSTANDTTRTLTAELFATGNGSERQSAFTLKDAGGASLQGFQLTGAINSTNGWSITEGHPAGGYTLAANHVTSSIAADSLIGKATLTLPTNVAGNSILDLSLATLGAANAPGRSLVFAQADMGSTGQLNGIFPDSNIALSLGRVTSDLVIGGVKPITAADALDALKLSVGLDAAKGSSWRELIAADINKDAKVTAADALEILKVSVGINTIQPSWVFVPTDTTNNPSLATMTRQAVTYKDEFNLASLTAPTAASFTAILVGDVNNSWLISP
ncbi:MAG: choice-of-anchor L domain-containing protein, partial [Burkholderiales bacterium]